MSIRIRLALAFAIAALVIFGVSGVLFERSFRHGVETSMDPGLRTQASALVRALRASGTGTIGLENAGGATGISTRDLVAQVIATNGKVLETTREAGTRRAITRDEVTAASRRSVTTSAHLGNEAEPYRVLAVPTSVGGHKRIVVVGTSLESTNDSIGRVRDALIVGGIAVVLVAGVGAWILARSALRPVERMRREAAVISEHDATAQLHVPRTRDEIAALGGTMNDLLARLRGALQRQRHFVADAGHELRTPLAVLRTELELARRRPRTHEQLMETVAAAEEEAERLGRLADELLFLAQADEAGTTVPRDHRRLLPILEEAADAYSERAHAHRVDLAVEGDPSTEAVVAETLLRRAVENLLDNALRYAPTGSRVTAGVRREAGSVVIEVADGGSGFPPEFLPHAFERFRRADDARSRRDGGTGLGLAIVMAVARAHGGSAQAANAPTGGAVVAIRINASASRVDDHAADSSSRDGAG